MTETELYQQWRRTIARRAYYIARQYPFIDRKDYEQEGAIGMLLGYRTFSANRGVAIGNWINAKIGYSLLNATRYSGWHVGREKGKGLVFITTDPRDFDTPSSATDPMEEVIALETIELLEKLPDRHRKVAEAYANAEHKDGTKERVALELGVHPTRVSNMWRQIKKWLSID